MDGSTAYAGMFSEEFIDILHITGELLLEILRKNSDIQACRGTVDVNQKMNRIFLL